MNRSNAKRPENACGEVAKVECRNSCSATRHCSTYDMGIVGITKLWHCRQVDGVIRGGGNRGFHQVP